MSRYYYQNGRLEASLNDDSEVTQSINILKDKDRYNKILTTVVKAEKPIYNLDTSEKLEEK